MTEEERAHRRNVEDAQINVEDAQVNVQDAKTNTENAEVNLVDAEGNVIAAGVNVADAATNVIDAEANHRTLIGIRNLVRLLALVVLFVAVVVAINSVVTTQINKSVHTQGDNIDNNTENIQQFGDEVRATKKTLDKAVARVNEGSGTSDELIADIRVGLDQIDKLCQQTNCEG